MTITAVFMDLYFTLAYFHPHRVERQRQTLAEFGFPLDEITLHRAYLAADHYYTLVGLESPYHLLSPEEQHRTYIRYQEVLMEAAGLGHAVHLAEQVHRRYWELDREFRLFPDVEPALDRLRDDGYRLGLITNVHSDPTHDLERVGLAGRVDIVVASCQAGFEKPDPRIFRTALEQMGVAPHEAVHVGDQFLADVEGATSVGIKAVLLDRYDVQGRRPAPRIRSLLDLPPLLRNGVP